ncbi:unnamed protein product [Ambrosiozyma monospora]|uniref:Unnamed protein product n=1 Tax=Ambrosiozyma monospora TaxID=43982 RepID=A0ACB5T0Z3_AMBMO|nr:unnamed protein product [Ambrosiozyma monospora]
MKTWIPTLTTILLFLTTSMAIPRKDMFQVDWQTVQIGKPISNVIQSTTDRKLISISDLGILSMLTQNNGQASFRYKFEKKIDIRVKVPILLQSNVHVNGSDAFVSTVNFQDGLSSVVFWSYEPASGVAFIEKEIGFQSHIIGVFQGSFNQDYIVVLANGEIQVLTSGYVASSVSPSQSDTFQDSKVLYNFDGTLIVLLKSSTGGVSYITLDPTYSVPTEWKQFKGCVFDDISIPATHSDSIICDNKDLYQFLESFTKVKSSPSLITEDLLLDDLATAINTTILAYQLVDDQFLVGFTGEEALIYDLDDSISKVPIYKFPFKYDPKEIESLSVFIPDKSKLSFTSILTVSKNLVISYTPAIALDVEINNPSVANAWKRDESLAYIVSSIIIPTNEKPDLSISDFNKEESTNVFSAYVNRLKRNYNLVFGDESKNSLDRDLHFGLVKTLVVLTKNGKVFGLDTLKHSNTAEPKKEFTNSEQINWVVDTGLYNLVKLYNTEDVNEIAILDDHQVLHKLDIEEGKLVNVHPRFIENNFRILNNHEGERVLKQTQSDNFYSLIVSDDKHSVQGVHVYNDSEKSTWSFTLDPEEFVLDVVSRSYDNEKVASNGIETTKRRVIYKFLVPNLAVLATYKATTQTLHIHLINVVSGEILQTLNRKTTQPDSLHIIFEENFIIFTLSESANSPDTIITSIDLFESTIPDLHTVHTKPWTPRPDFITYATQFFTTLNPFSSFSKSTVSDGAVFNNTVSFVPEIEVASFYIPARQITSLAISETRNNIAMKMIVLHTDLGELIGYPKFLINGRRSKLNDNKKNQERWLPPYNPVVPLSDRSQFSHYRNVIGSSQDIILSEPTNLESTTVIAYVGTDVFVTLVKPSGGFDVMDLKEFKKRD